MNGGPDNPLGPRALYLYRDGHDTFFRLHGTIEPDTIGRPSRAAASACSIRTSSISITACRSAPT